MAKKDVVKRVHPYAWLWEAIEEDARALVKPMFGGKSLCFEARMCLHFAAKEEPWRGVLVCTDRDRQAALIEEWPVLRPHPVLPKWLYLPEAEDEFESVARALVRAVRARDPRIGVATGTRQKRAKRREGPGRGD